MAGKLLKGGAPVQCFGDGKTQCDYYVFHDERTLSSRFTMSKLTKFFLNLVGNSHNGRPPASLPVLFCPFDWM